MAQHHLVARGQHVGAGNGTKITGELKTSKEVVDAGRRATKSVSRQIGENPVISVLVGSDAGGFNLLLCRRCLQIVAE